MKQQKQIVAKLSAVHPVRNKILSNGAGTPLKPHTNSLPQYHIKAGYGAQRDRRKVFVAMSGGVDSSVAAYLLKKRGYDVVGVFMKCWSGGAPFDTFGRLSASKLRADCTTEVDATDARRVAEKIGIPFYVWDFEKEYKKKVVDYMIRGYRKGITPNPDVMCNREIKFGLFLKKALAMGADYVATGHYVRLAFSGKRLGNRVDKKLNAIRYTLYAAMDKNKDQSYFLWTLTQKQLARCLFPIGEYTKPRVRAMARRAKLPTADKKDSQGICFLGKVSIEDFLKQYIPAKRGAILGISGEKLGEHIGAHFYTIGQRHGIGIKRQALRVKGQVIGTRKDSQPHYVVKKDIKTNTLIVAEGSEHPALYQKEATLTDVHFISPCTLHASRFKFHVFARVRYRQPLVSATLILNSKLPSSARASTVTTNFAKASMVKKAMVGKHASCFKLLFDRPVKFVAPGQSAVFYTQDSLDHSRRNHGFRMLGGGIIM